MSDGRAGEPAFGTPGDGAGSPAGRPVEWARVAVGVGAFAYTLLGTWDIVVATTSLGNRITQAAVAIVCIAAIPLSRRWPHPSALVVISAIWLQLVWTLVANGVPVPALLAFPVLAAGAGLLAGGRAALLVGVASAVVIPIAYVAGRAVSASGDIQPIDINWLAIADVCTLGVALMTRTALASYRRLLEASETARLRYRQLFQDAPDGLVELDEVGRIVEANAEARRILGAGGEVVGTGFPAALRAIGVAEPPDLSMARPGLPVSVEVPATFGRAARHVEIGVGVEAGPARHRLVLSDVTERRFLEERLGHAQRLETVGQLAGGVAHDFNNLLTVVGGNAAQLSEHGDPEVRQLSREILDAQERGAALTRQLLAFGRREVRQPLRQDLASVVSGISRLLGRLLGEQHRLRLVLEGPAPVFADRGQIEQVTINLVTNARDAMPGGGEVEVAVRRLPLEEARRLGSALDAGSQVLLQVTDVGVGMSGETLRQIFQPFFTTKPRGKGTGLGLATVHGIVIQSGGCTAVDSAPARGTRFRVFLPEMAQAAAAGQVGAERPAPTRGTERVLLVEDDAAVLALARRTLERAGYRVTAATGGEAAEAAGRAGRFDLLLSDVMMPGTGGIELARRLRAYNPGLRVLLMSGYHEVEEGEQPAGPRFPLLAKPFEPAELLQRVRAALDGERGVSPGG